MKKILSLLLVLVIAAGAASAVVYKKRDAILAGKIKKGLEVAFGVPVVVMGVRSSFAKPFDFSSMEAQIDEIQINNPAGFAQPNLAVVKSVRLALDPLALISGKWEIASLSANLDEISVEKNAQGEVNLSKLAALTSRVELASAAANSFEIAKLEYRYGVLYYYEPGADPEHPETHDFEEIKEVFSHVKNPDLLIQAPALKVVNQLGRGSLGVRRGKIQEKISKSLG